MPDAFDMTVPIVVTVNGQLVYDAPLEPDARLLLGRLAPDFDRSALSLAAQLIDVP